MTNSEDIKIAVLSYYRYKHQQIAADEVGFMLGNTDVSSLRPDGWLVEIEIKVSKSDLWQGEKRKGNKHKIYLNPTDIQLEDYIIPNQFYLCVPRSLLETAEKWVLTNNEKYGILEYIDGETVWFSKPEDKIRIWKRAKVLHKEIHSTKALDKIARRLSSANINLKTNLQKVIKQNKELSCQKKEITDTK